MNNKIKIIRKKPVIAYAGSVLQNNFGESLHKGYLFWDIEKKKSEFIAIENDFGFYTLDILNKNIPNVTDMPKKCRLRLKTHGLNNTEISEVVMKVRKKYQPYEITINRINLLNDNETGEVDSNLDILNVKDINYQNDLIKTYLNLNYNIDDEMLESVLEINRNLNPLVETEDFARNVKWKPLTFKWSNLFSYGKDNFIDFSNFNGIGGIFAQNASGKSALIDSLTFCLFDKTSREFKPANIMNNKSNSFNCEISFLLSSKKYFIKRTAKKEKKTNRIIYKVDFWIENDDKTIINLNGDNRWDTNKNIKSKIGKFEDFILSTYSVQDNNTGFIDRGHSERKDLIIEFVGLGLFDLLYDVAAVDMKNIQSKLKILESKNLAKAVLLAENNYIKLESNYDDLLNKKDIHFSELTEKNNTINKLKNKLIPISDTYDINKLNGDEKTLNFSLEIYNKNIKKIKESIEKYENDIKILNDSITMYEMLNVEKLYNEFINLEKDKSDIKTDLILLETTIKNKLEKMKKLGKLEYDPNCTFCMNNIFVKDAINIKKELALDKNKYIEIKNESISITDIINTKVDIKDKYKSYHADKRKLSDIQFNLNTENAKHTEHNTNIEHTEFKLKLNKESIKKYNELETVIQNNNIVEKQIQDTNESTAIIDNILVDIEEQILSTYGELKVAESTLKNIKEDILDLHKTTVDFDVYKYYTEAIKRDGVPYEIISKIVPIIEYEVNNILSQIVNFSILIDLDDSKNINMHIAYDDDRIWPLELSSGMEKFISSIALRVALTNISNLPRPNFLVIDEGWGKLDSDNLNSVGLLLDYLKTQFNFVIVISHIDSMRDMADFLIEIKKDKFGKSKISHNI